jgi:thiol:disulfide interchange protein DsbC
MRAILLTVTLGFASAATPAPAPAPAVAPAATAPADPRIELAARIPGVKPEELRASPIAGVYEITRGADVTYVSADGRYLIAGDLYQIAKTGDYPNLSDARRRELRSKIMAQVPETQMIVFAPKSPKYTITVFTDPDCTWCRKLHSQIAEYNRLGIKVRYAFFPREGPDTEAWFKSEAVWCSADRKEALTRAKLGQVVKASKCAPTPVRQTWELGKRLGVEGTPNIVLADGEVIPGYLPPQQLLAHLAQPAKADLSLSAAPASAAKR